MKSLGNNVFELSNPKTGETRKVNGSDLYKYGLTAPKTGGWSDLLPAAGGIVGGVLGGLAGSATDVVSGPAGTVGGSMLGSGLGQTFGEYAKEWLQKTGISPENLIKQGAEGTLYGMVPELKGVGILGKIAARAGLGAAISGGATAIEDTGKGKTTGQKATDIALSSAMGGFTFPIIGGSFDAMGGVMRFLGQIIPKDLMDQVTTRPQEVLNGLHEKVQGMLVGQDNVGEAISEGVIPRASGITTDVINNGVAKSKVVSNAIEDQLQQELKGSDVRIPYQTSGLFSFINDIPNQMQSSAKGASLRMKLLTIAQDNIDSTVAVAGKEPTVDLSTINQMKRAVGDMYSQETAGIYNHLKTMVETQSGVPDTVRQLNQRASQWMDIKTVLGDWQDQIKRTRKPIPLELSPQGISDAIQGVKEGTTKSMDTLINFLSLGGLVGGMQAGKVISGTTSGAAVGGVGGMMGLRVALKSGIQYALQSPENKIAFSNFLSHSYQSTTDLADKLALRKAAELLGIRLGSSVTK